jgi:hypothetical protein
VEEAVTAGEEFQVEVVPGVEISAEHSPGTMHILGYCLDTTDPDLLGALRVLQQARAARNPKIIQRLRALGLDISLGEVLALSGGQPGRPHIAQALVDRGYVSDRNDAFRRYLRKGGPAYVEKFRFPPHRAIAMIRRAGGIAVLAHPFTLEISEAAELARVVGELTAMGLEGIEVYYPEHTEQMTAHYETLADTFGLLCTGGSDFHGALKDDTRLGGEGAAKNLRYELLQALRHRLQERNPH